MGLGPISVEGEDKPLIPTQHSGREDAFPAVMNSGSGSTHRTKPVRSEIMESEEKWRKER
jgi:hypothetical protein